MIAPLMLAVADLGLWLLWRLSWSYEDNMLSIIVFALALSVLVWTIIEFAELFLSFDDREEAL